MRAYYNSIRKDVFSFLPLTFHIKGVGDREEFNNFTLAYNRRAEASRGRNIWIVKPGENSNRGNGIRICSTIEEIRELSVNNSHTLIVQQYLDRPLLYQKRKFDIRCYIIISSINGC
jgi:hypothetical protein